ncbi:juvenile hormone esterase-like [Topomyia yanbarensis]|uniref:juvenile hormone esterase-like n=1 Tax=Topomyia yanbarensis TaxID=2498891 RepID=UPI00273AC72E|nr:juvenile hormone esterase-like [Topomyia yanbarensis]
MHFAAFISIGIIISNSVVADSCTKPPVVHTSLGSIKGSVLESRLGRQFFAFRGIRYAQPPTGELRFQAPKPVTAWEDLLDATEDGPMCPQPAYNRSEVSEDCLRLNVYTKQIPGELIRIRPQSVLVYIHPGGFYAFSGQSRNNAGPQYLMDQDIVLVTINYRLGSLGFMSTGTADCPGNAGLKDQVMALRWIRDHISSFGGNPDSVTLMGYSAGALSSALHLISPMSRGLFHRAIVMSAAATSQVDIPTDQIELARKQAALLGCEVTPTEKMVACLRQKPATEFADSLEYMFVISWNPVLLWKPVVEPNLGQERFLDRDPTEAFLKGDFMKVPIIAGITKDEFAGPAVAFLKNETLRNELDQNFDTLAPVLFLYERHTEESRNRSKLLREKFLGDESLSLSNSLTGLNYLFADSLIGFAMHRFIQLASRHTTVYQYKFSYVGRYSFLYYPDDKTPYGAVHHDDLLYLLVIPSRAPIFNVTDPENSTVERVTGMWSTFAKTGNPNKADKISMPDWIPVSSTEDHYLNIGQELVMERGLFTERFAFWDQLFPIPSVKND